MEHAVLNDNNIRINTQDSESQIRDTDKFVSEYNAGKSMVNDIDGAKLEYGTEDGTNYGWSIVVPGTTEKDSISVSIGGISDTDKFVEQYNNARKIVDGTSETGGLGLSYNAQDGWQISYTSGNDADPTYINVSSIEDVDSFISDYNTIATTATKVNEDKDGSAVIGYGEKGWSLTLGEVNVTAGDIGTDIDSFVAGYKAAGDVKAGLDGYER